MYLLPIPCYRMILKLALTIVTKVVDWGKTKWHIFPKGAHGDFLKQDFE